MIMACDFCWEENPSVLLMSPPFLHPGTWSSPCAPAQPAAWPTWASSHLTFSHDCICKCYVGHISCCKHIYNTQSLCFVSYKWHVASSGPKHQHPLESFHFSRLPNQKVWKSVWKKNIRLFPIRMIHDGPFLSPFQHHLFTWKNRYNLFARLWRWSSLLKGIQSQILIFLELVGGASFFIGRATLEITLAKLSCT